MSANMEPFVKRSWCEYNVDNMSDHVPLSLEINAFSFHKKINGVLCIGILKMLGPEN